MNNILKLGNTFRVIPIVNSIDTDIKAALYNTWNIRLFNEVDSYLLNWDYNYFISQINDDGEINHQGKEYETIYINKINYKLIKKIALSFRSYKGINVVLIKGIY